MCGQKLGRIVIYRTVKKTPSLKIIFLVTAALMLAGCKPSLTKTNANRIIPNGMSESNVYVLLGTNAIVKQDDFGNKHLIYFSNFSRHLPELIPKFLACKLSFQKEWS
jgi:hypothetical protein